MNNMQKCLNRDAAIVSLLHTHSVMCTEQIAALLFRGQRYPLVSCRRRLRSLTQHGRISRRRFAPYASNVYCVDGWPRQWEHRLGINWAYCWLRQQLKPGEALATWQTPYYSGSIRPDALWEVVSREGSQFGFLELDRGTNKFDKVTLYNDYYSGAEYQLETWAARAERFPQVLVVTTTPARRNRILRAVAADNARALRFETILFSTVRSSVVDGLLASSARG